MKWYLKKKKSHMILVDENGRYRNGYRQDSVVVDPDDVGFTLKGERSWMVLEKEIYPCLTPGRQEKRQNGPRFRGENEEMFTLTSQDIHGVMIKEPNTCLIQPVDRDYNKKGDERKVHIETKDDGISHALRTNGETMVNENRMKGLRIRKLTPKECWRLQGWDDESFEKAEKVNSNSALYKQAGNGIAINCFAALIKQLL